MLSVIYPMMTVVDAEDMLECDDAVRCRLRPAEVHLTRLETCERIAWSTVYGLSAVRKQ
jgi:hypothetical protein